jgi:hypothetical protein
MVIEQLMHSHVFLSEEHENSERKTWAVIWLVTGLVSRVPQSMGTSSAPSMA